MRGLLTKIFYEVWIPTLLFGCALLGIKAVLTLVLPHIQEGYSQIFHQIPLIKTMISALIGTDVGDELNAHTMQAFLWVHPVVLAIVWAHEITFCSRMPAGEIDRGTIDVLLGFPVSRRTVYLSETLVWLLSGLVILLMGLLGHRIAAPAMSEDIRPELPRMLMATTNLFCVYIAVGGIAYLVSACCDRRGRAMVIVFAIVLASYLLNFVAQFWEPASRIVCLSVLQYYQPAQILQSGEFPQQNMTVLLIVGSVAWLAGGEILARRSICTV